MYIIDPDIKKTSNHFMSPKEVNAIIVNTFQVSGRVASQTTMGYVIDDPTKPQDVGEAAKKFFNEGTNINCHGEWTPRCCPIFSMNQHVLDWLSKPDRAR